MVTLLIMLLTSCQSTKTESIPYPEFPILKEYTRNETEGTVTVPESYIVDLAEFKIKYDLLKEMYKEQSFGY